jgi:hypothetical protein
MSAFFLAKYNTQTTFRFPVVKRGVVDLAATADWTPATGDTKISKDGGNFANTTNNPSATGGTGSVGWTLTLTATELSAAEINVQIVDSATKAIEDQWITIYTYGNASAKIIPDWSDAVRMGLTALPNAAAEAAGGLYTRGTGAGQINQPGNGLIDVSLKAILNTALTETAGQIAAAFKKWFDVAAPVGTVNSIPNATAGASGGLFIAGTNAATTVTTALTTTFTGNLTGSVASVTAGVTLAASAVQAIWDALTSALTTVGSIGKLLVDNVNATISSRLASASYTTPPTAAAISDQVWEEAIADHSGTAGSTAEKLAAAGAAGDPWATALPGAYSAGQAGKIVGDNLNATMSSRLASASYTAPPTVVQTADEVQTRTIAAVTTVGSVTGAVGSVTATVNADVKKVNGATVNGTGVLGDEWGP